METTTTTTTSAPTMDMAQLKDQTILELAAGRGRLLANWLGDPKLRDLLATDPVGSEEEIGTTRDGRAWLIKKWMRRYNNLTIAEYSGVGAVVVHCADATLTDRVTEFPSVALFVSVALAVQSGALPKKMTGEAPNRPQQVSTPKWAP